MHKIMYIACGRVSITKVTEVTPIDNFQEVLSMSAFNSRYSFKNYVVGGSNEFAYTC